MTDKQASQVTLECSRLCGLLISPRTPSKDEKNSASAKQKNERSRSLFVGYFLFCVLSCGCSLGTLPNEGCMQKDCVTNPKARFVPYFILGTDHYSFRLSNYYQKKTRVRALQPCPVFWFKQILAQALPHHSLRITKKYYAPEKMANATSKRNNGSSLGAFSFWSPEPRMSMLCRPNESFSNLRVFANEEYSKSRLSLSPSKFCYDGRRHWAS